MLLAKLIAKMKNFLFLLLFLPLFLSAQLTVEQIMRDPRWIGTSPSDVFWDHDSKSVYFKWNPENNISDSFYAYQLDKNKIYKHSYTDAKLALDISNGRYNASKTKKVFIHNNLLTEVRKKLKT